MSTGGLSIVVCDDEAPARARLTQVLGDIAAECPHELVHQSSGGREALDWVIRWLGVRPALASSLVVLLDVEMPDMSGLEVARRLSSLKTPPCVILVTAYEHFALPAYEVQVLDYLVKPVRAQRLLASLQRAARMARSTPPLADTSDRRSALMVQERGRWYKIPLNDVIYLRATTKYVAIHTRDRIYLSDESLVSLEEEFSDLLLRIHRNTLVARAAMTGLERIVASAEGDAQGVGSEGNEGQWGVRVGKSNELLPVSRRQWPQVKALMRSQGKS